MGRTDEKSRTWSIPGSRTKNKKAHIVHLSEPAWQVIAQRPVGTYLFGTSGAKHFQAYSTSKRAPDTLSGITGCRPHDRRRTIVSGMARLGVPPHVADKILNHQAGTISGVAAVYQRHEFLVERKEPLDRWGAHVEHIVQALSLKTDDQTFVAPQSKEKEQTNLPEPLPKSKLGPLPTAISSDAQASTRACRNERSESCSARGTAVAQYVGK